MPRRSSRWGAATDADAAASTSALSERAASGGGSTTSNSGKRSRDFSRLVSASSSGVGLHAVDESHLTWADVRPDSKRVRAESDAPTARRAGPSVHPSRQRAVDSATQRTAGPAPAAQCSSAPPRVPAPPPSGALSGPNSVPVGEEGPPLEDDAPAIKPEFGLSGALAEDAKTGNVYRGVVMKFSEPADARKPTKKWRLYVFKGEQELAVLHISRQSAYLVGRDEKVADIKALHPSLSKQHAVIQFRMRPRRGVSAVETAVEGAQYHVLPYIMDLESTNGTLLNGKKIAAACYVELRARDKINFGNSSRDYVLLCAEH